MKFLIKQIWKIPFFRFLTPFIFGVIAGELFRLPTTLLISLTALFVGASLVYRPFINHSSDYHKRWIFGGLISISLFFISYSRTVIYNTNNSQIEQAETIVGIINEPPKQTAKSVKITLKTMQYEANYAWIKDHSKLLIFLEKDSLAKSLRYGDILSISGDLKAVENSGNPNEFDYKTYLYRKKIYFQAYKNSKQWILLEKNKGKRLYKFAYNIRNKLLRIYEKAGIKGDEFAILSALTLGVKDYLSDDIVKNYSHSGAMHVLAVSGLHVGIITMMLNFLLSVFRKNPKLRIVHTIIVIAFLWIFAIITGLTPSVTRSALMFSFFIVGSNSGKKPNSLNSLAASAFILLSFNPNTLFYVGFQLSFLAVTSILLFQQSISKLLVINNFIGNQIWQLTSVSIAAQIGTTPISIYYFHQFPIYALLTNIIVIPAAMLIMYLTVLLLISSIIGLFSNYVGILLSFVINLLNRSTQFIENLPFSSIEFISLSSAELVISYAIIICITIMFSSKSKNMLFAILILLISIFVIRDFRYFKHLNSNKLIVFNTNRKSAIASINGLQMTLYADTSIINNRQNISYLCANMITKNSIKNFQTSTLLPDSSTKFPAKFININTTRIAYLNEKVDRFKSDRKLPLDYIILGKNSSINIEYLTFLFDFDNVIIDASMPKWKQSAVEKSCTRKRIKCFNVSKKGAFILDN